MIDQGFILKLPGFSASTLDPLYQNNKCFDDKIRFVFSHLQKNTFIDLTSLCLFHSAFMGANNVLGGSFALLIDGQMVYKQVLLLSCCSHIDTTPILRRVVKNSIFLNHELLFRSQHN